MPMIAVSDEVYSQLSARAEDCKITVEQLLELILERRPAPTVYEDPNDLPYDVWKARFDATIKAAESRAWMYPDGFVADDSRETIYGDREDGEP